MQFIQKCCNVVDQLKSQTRNRYIDCVWFCGKVPELHQGRNSLILLHWTDASETEFQY